MTDRVIIKFGGADLSSGERIREAARMVIESNYQEKVVVVSAMGKTTDKLVKTITQLDISPQDYAEILSMGERTSARVFCSTLKALGAKATFIDPALEHFPIITDSNFTNAQPDLEKTRMNIKKYLEPLLGGIIPVVCGFLGRDSQGRITMLGRGGSDTTATLLAACLEANEIILVKDIHGVLSADPEIVADAKTLKKLNIYEMFALAQGGAKIVKAEALRYKLPDQKLVIVDFSSKDLTKVATEITGEFNPNIAEVRSFNSLSAITIVGKIDSMNLNALFSAINGEPFSGISTGKSCITIFGKFNNPKKVVNRLHGLGCFKAVTFRGNVGMIEVIHPTFVDSPGWVAKITSSLALKGINLIEVTTGKATINLFIDETSLEDAIKTVRDLFEV